MKRTGNVANGPCCGSGMAAQPNVTMADREIALDIGRKWLDAQEKVKALEALLNERLPGWGRLLSPILVRMPLSPQQQLDVLQNAIDEDKSGDSVIRILYQVLFES